MASTASSRPSTGWESKDSEKSIHDDQTKIPAQQEIGPRTDSWDSNDEEETTIGFSTPKTTTRQPTPAATRSNSEAINPTDWNSLKDPDNPLNWSKRKKIYHTIATAAIAFTCAIGSSIYTPGRPGVEQEFGVSAELSLLPYILYVLGLGVGPCIAAPCSETFGRRAVYLAGMPLFALFVLGAGVSQSLASLSTCRAFAGFSGSPGLAIGSALISDVWAPAERAVPMTLCVMTPFLGPAIGPLIGGFIVQNPHLGWRWTQWVLLFLTIISTVPAIFTHETYKKVILRRRAVKAGLVSSSSGEKQLRKTALTFVTVTLTRPLHMAIVEPVVLLFTIYVSLNFGMLYAFFAAFPYVFEVQYGFDLSQIGLTFIGLGVGSVLGTLVTILWTKCIFIPQVRAAAKKGERPAPEARLFVAMIGSFMLPPSLFLFAWTAHFRVHWIVPVIGEVLFACGNILIFMACVMYLMDFYGPMYGASAMAANNLLRYVIGAAFPLFAVQMFMGLGIGWAVSLLGFVQVALFPIPWLFWTYGARLRQRTRYAPV